MGRKSTNCLLYVVGFFYFAQKFIIYYSWPEKCPISKLNVKFNVEAFRQIVFFFIIACLTFLLSHTQTYTTSFAVASLKRKRRFSFRQLKMFSCSFPLPHPSCLQAQCSFFKYCFIKIYCKVRDNVLQDTRFNAQFSNKIRIIAKL